MPGVRTKHTASELKVSNVAHRLGYRFRLHHKDLAGSPDIVFPRLKVAVFVNGLLLAPKPKLLKSLYTSAQNDLGRACGSKRLPLFSIMVGIAIAPRCPISRAGTSRFTKAARQSRLVRSAIGSTPAGRRKIPCPAAMISSSSIRHLLDNCPQGRAISN